MPPSAAIEEAEQLKVEAERLLNVDCQRSLEIADQIRDLRADASIQALGLLARADALRELGRHAQAMEAYQTSADLYRQIGDEIGWARTRIGATLTCRYTGAHTEVLGDLDHARRILADHQLWVRLARLETFSGGLLAAQGRTTEGLAAHARALDAVARIAPANDGLQAEVLGNLAIAHYQVDDFERAEDFHRRAVEIFEREGQREHLARAHRNYARFAAGRGHYSTALAAVLPGRRVLLEMGRIEGAAHLGQVGVDCLLRLNRAAEAAALAVDVAAEFLSIGAPVDAAVTHGLRGLAVSRLGDAAAALADLDHADELFGTADWDSGLASVRLGRAVILGETGHWARALEEASAVRDVLRRQGSVARIAEADLVRARALRALGQVDAAAVAATSALRLLEDRALPWLAYHAWRLLGELARDAGDRVTALDAFEHAIASLEHVQGKILTEYRASFLADKVDVYESAVDLVLEQGDARRAFELVERAKSRALVDALAGGLDIRVRARTPEQRTLVDELGRLRRAHDGSVERPELLELERQIGVILEELRLAGAEDLERLSLLAGRVYSPQAQLDGATALLEFYAVGPDLVVFVVDKTNVRGQRLSGAGPQIARLRRALDLNVQSAMSAPGRRAALHANARTVLARMYDVLLRPVAAWLDGYTRLVVVAHGALHQVPFAALHTGQAYLVETYEVVVAPSASALTFCLRARQRDRSSAEKPCDAESERPNSVQQVGPGNAAPRAQGTYSPSGRVPRAWRALVVGHSANGRLAGALDEARAVSQMFESDCLLEAEATADRVRELARGGQADLIHVAAHGVARLDAPLFSSIRLTEGDLTALDCFDLELDCALVTLSACESGVGLIEAGDEQIGLPRAFLYAGARAVLHSLWRIDDLVTQTFMTQFYGQLKVGQGRGAALRAGQLAALQSVDSHPFFWAGFVLVGDWR